MVSRPLSGVGHQNRSGSDQGVDEVAEQGDAEDGGDKVFDHGASQGLPIGLSALR